MVRSMVVFLAAAAPMWGCGSGLDVDPGEPGGNPLVPEVAVLPFPSDFYLAEDDSTLTGRRIEVPAEVLPELLDPSVVASADGFSRITPIVTYMEGGFSPATLPPFGDGAATMEAESSVQLIDAETGERVPALVELDLTEPFAEDRALLIRPLILLKANHGYVVALTDDLQRADGVPHAANDAFRALRDGQDSDVADLERQREAYQLVWDALEMADLDRQQVVQAWSFHTRSEEQVVGDLLAMQSQAGEIAIGGYDIASDVVEGDNRQLVGTFEVPSFLGEDGMLQRDGEGRPVAGSTLEVPFNMTLPSSADGEGPIMLYGHGFLGGPVQATRGFTNDIAQARGIGVVAAHIGFNNTNEVATIKALTDLEKLPAVVADVQQNMVNQTILARMARAKLGVDYPALGTNEVVYMGASNGGTFGALATATSAEFPRSVLIVGGGGLIHFLERAVQWNDFSPLINVVLDESRERQAAFALLQVMLDPIDCMNYAEHLVHDRYPGNETKVMKIMAVNDSQVRNLVSEWVARTAQLPLVVPSPKDIFGLRTVETSQLSEEDGAFFVYDERVEAAPKGNLPPLEDNDTHGTVRDLPAFQTQVGHFLITGELTQVCDGPCDPQ